MDSIQAAQAVAEWAEKGQTAAPPAWEELPSIPLYMDQVILYLGESLELFQGEGEPSLLTSSMINNYVKNGLIPHPQKKKYAKEHLAGLMAVCMLKQVLSIQDVKTLLGSGEISPQTYQLFRQAHTAALQETCQGPGGDLPLWAGLEAGRPAAGGGGQRQAGRRPADSLRAGPGGPRESQGGVIPRKGGLQSC